MRSTTKFPSSNRFSYPMCSKLTGDHIARYSQRITDIFENNEEDEDDKIVNCKPFSKFTATQNRAFTPFVPKSSYKSVLEETKIIEAKYKKMNDEEEDKRPKTEFDHLRPTRNKFCIPSIFEPSSRVNLLTSKSSNSESSQKL